MFCGKCGSFIDGDQPLCDKCAAEEAAQQVFANEAAEQFTQQVYANEAADTVITNDVFELNTSEPAKAPKKSPKKRGLVAGIVAASVAVAMGVGAFIGWPYIKAFYNRTFQEPEEYFVDVQKSAISQYSNDITSSYGKIMDMYYTDGSGELTGFETELKVEVGDELLALLESNVGTEMDLDFLKDIRVSMNMNSDDSLIQLIMAASLGKTQIVSADVIMDLAESKLFAAVPELNKQYLMIDASDIDTGVSIDEMKQAIAEAAATGDKIAAALPSEETLNALLNDYIAVALDCIDDVEKSNDTIEVGDASQKVVVLTATITEEDLYEMCVAVLEEAKDDQELKQVINDLSGVFNELYGYEMDLYPQFQEAVEAALEEMDIDSEDFSDDNYLEWVTYVDMKGEVCGYEMVIYSEDEDEMEVFTWLTATKGKTTYIECEIPSGNVELEGEKVETKGGTEGFYELSVAGMDLGTLEFETVTDTRTTLRLIPSEAVMDELLANSSLPTALISGNVALELSFGEDEAGASFLEVGLMAANKKLITIGVSGKAVSGGDVSVPSNTVDVTDSSALNQWLSNVDLQELIDGLERAGVPQELLDTIQNYAGMVQSFA